MASQLALRIATLLDKKGFDDFKRESKTFVDNIRQANTSTQSLQESFSNLGKVLVGVFAASGIKNFIASALEAERATAIIAGRFKTLGDTGITSARDVEVLTASLAKQSQFSQTELLQALTATLRTAKSSGEAFNVLSTAQVVAAATGKDLASAAFAITRAQQGATRPLQILTGLTTIQIKQLNEQDKLLPTLTAKFKDAADAVGNTLAAQLERANNRFSEIGQSIGDILLPIVKALVDILDKVPTPLLTGATATAAFTVVTKGFFAALTLLNKALATTTVAAPAAAGGLGAFSAAATGATVGATGLTGALRLLGVGISAVAPLAIIATIFAGFSKLQEVFAAQDEATAKLALKFAGVPEVLLGNVRALGTLEQQIAGVTNTVAFLNEELEKVRKANALGVNLRVEALLKDLGKAEVLLKNLQAQKEFIDKEGAKEEEKRFRELTQTKDIIRATDLANQIIFLRESIAAGRFEGDELKAREQQLVNDLIELRKIGLDQIVKAHEDANKKIALLEQAVAARRPADTAQLAEREQNKLIDAELRLRNRKLEIAKTAKEDADKLAVAEFEAGSDTATRRAELEKKLSDNIKEERSKQLGIHQEFEEKIRDFEFSGRKDLREEERRKIEELARQQESRIDREERLDRATQKRLGLVEEEKIPASVEIRTVEFSGDLTQQITEAFRKKLGDNFIIIKVKEPAKSKSTAPSGKR